MGFDSTASCTIWDAERTAYRGKQHELIVARPLEASQQLAQHLLDVSGVGRDIHLKDHTGGMSHYEGRVADYKGAIAREVSFKEMVKDLHKAARAEGKRANARSTFRHTHTHGECVRWRARARVRLRGVPSRAARARRRSPPSAAPPRSS